MDIHILGPDDDYVAYDSYEVWLDPSATSFDGVCIGIGKTKVEAITSAQRELHRLSRHLSEMV